MELKLEISFTVPPTIRQYRILGEIAYRLFLFVSYAIVIQEE